MGRKDDKRGPIGKWKMKRSLTTPVLFLIFNRPDTTQQVFNEIRKAQPKQLFVAADGPRQDRPDDIENCKKVREIIQQIDWDCNVSTLLREGNLGCKKAISSAIDWFFSQVDEGIILEDDCVPDQSFFPFCQELLERYRHDSRVMMISGDNFQFGKRRTEYSYYFSRYAHIWGWATWKRAWNYFDISMKLWPVIRDGNWLDAILDDAKAVKYWTHCFDNTFTGKMNTWDYQWVLTCWIQRGLSIIPEQNLITNIGFNQSGTHTLGKSIFSKLPVTNIKFPLIHPGFVIRNFQADKFTEKIWYSRSRSLKSVSKFGLTMLKNKLS